MKDIYFSDLTMEELETLCRDANNELIRRKKQEQKEDWEKVVTALKVYIKKYEEIEIDYGGDGIIVFFRSWECPSCLLLLLSWDLLPAFLFS